jgi:hypothetical protein
LLTTSIIPNDDDRRVLVECEMSELGLLHNFLRANPFVAVDVQIVEVHKPIRSDRGEDGTWDIYFVV